MKFSRDWKGTAEPTDAEIERDVAELRNLLSRLEEPAEPHPAYWQNFLVKVRTRVDEDRSRRRSWAPSMAFTSLAAAALVVVVAVSGVLPIGNNTPIVGEKAVTRRNLPVPAKDAGNPYAAAGEVESLMLSSDDVQMLDAILDEDPNAVLEAMVESGS